MKVLLADDHRIVRDGLRWMLSSEPDIEIVSEAANGQELLDLLRVDPDVDIVLLDLRMPGIGGLEALERLVPGGGASHGPAVVILSMHHEPATVRRAIELGAAGYLLKNTTRERLLEALRQVAAGNAYVESDVTALLFAEVAGGAPSQSPPRLTQRCLEILRLVAAGRANKQIAVDLGIGEATVKTHLKQIFGRLGAVNRAEAAAKAIQLGLIDPE